MLPSLNGLRAFEVVARRKSVTRAALELSVSQSAVSHQIRNLESILRVRLFERHGHALSLTRQGETLYAGLGRAFALLRQSVADLQAEFEADPMGISLRTHFATHWLAPRLAGFWLAHPGFDLRFFHSNAPADFSNLKVHVAIEWLRDDEVGPDALLLVSGELTPACSPTLSKGPQALSTPADLVHHTLLYESREGTWPEWLDAAGLPGLEPARRVFYEDTNVRQQTAIEGGGVALVCPTLVADDLAAGRLVCPFDLRLETYGYYVVVPPHCLEIVSVRRFVSWLKSERRI